MTNYLHGLKMDVLKNFIFGLRYKNVEEIFGIYSMFIILLTCVIYYISQISVRLLELELNKRLTSFLGSTLFPFY